MPSSPRRTPRPSRRPAARRPATSIVTGVVREDVSPAAVGRRFRALVEDGAQLLPAGRARHDPEVLLSAPYLPRHEIRLFDTLYFLSDFCFNEALGFFVGSVVLGAGDGRPVRAIHPRIFYKDSSLVWRVASHFVHDHDEYWIGKGDTRWIRSGGEELLTTVEETTNLPYEIQTALDTASRTQRRRRNDEAIELVLREGPSRRIQPYADFVAPRRRAAAGYRIHGGRSVARLTRAGDPGSLRFAAGFEPDFEGGVLEESSLHSRFYGGRLRKLRILSRNAEIQYLFVASPTHAWVNPPQALTTELSTYGVRVHDVLADEDIFIPGFEYHEDAEGEADDAVLLSQIPAGFVGLSHPLDPHRADAAAWIEELPVIREFRARVLRRRRKG